VDKKAQKDWDRRWRELNETAVVKTLLFHIHLYRNYTDGIHCATCNQSLEVKDG